MVTKYNILFFSVVPNYVFDPLKCLFDCLKIIFFLYTTFRHWRQVTIRARVLRLKKKHKYLTAQYIIVVAILKYLFGMEIRYPDNFRIKKNRYNFFFNLIFLAKNITYMALLVISSTYF